MHVVYSILPDSYKIDVDIWFFHPNDHFNYLQVIGKTAVNFKYI